MLNMISFVDEGSEDTGYALSHRLEVVLIFLMMSLGREHYP